MRLAWIAAGVALTCVASASVVALRLKDEVAPAVAPADEETVPVAALPHIPGAEKVAATERVGGTPAPPFRQSTPTGAPTSSRSCARRGPSC